MTWGSAALLQERKLDKSRCTEVIDAYSKTLAAVLTGKRCFNLILAEGCEYLCIQETVFQVLFFILISLKIVCCYMNLVGFNITLKWKNRGVLIFYTQCIF